MNYHFSHHSRLVTLSLSLISLAPVHAGDFSREQEYQKNYLSKQHQEALRTKKFNLAGGVFIWWTFDDLNFHNIDLSNAVFIACRFKNVNFDGASVANARFAAADGLSPENVAHLLACGATIQSRVEVQTPRE